MCPFSYWRAREVNSERKGIVNVIKVRRQKDVYIWAKGKRTCVLLANVEQDRQIQNARINFIKVWRQKKSDL